MWNSWQLVLIIAWVICVGVFFATVYYKAKVNIVCTYIIILASKWKFFIALVQQCRIVSDLWQTHNILVLYCKLSNKQGKSRSKVKVSKFQNEFMKSSFPSKYEPNSVRISALYCATLQGRNLYKFWLIFWEKRWLHKFILKFTDL